MLQDVYYILNPDTIQRPVPAVRDAIIGLHFEIPGEKDRSYFFQTIENFIPDSPFCLFIRLLEPLTSDQAMDLIAFLFFSNYYKPGGIPQIFMEAGNGSIVQAAMELIQQSARAQGFSTIHLVPAATTTMFPATDRQTIQEVYKSWLRSASKTIDALYITVSQPEDIVDVNQVLEAEEAVFQQEDQGLFLLKMQNRQLKKQVQELDLRCQAAKQEISNQVAHNQILRSSSQATALQNYYNNEYELLPLWYKRLGHLIKAFMGKRSFRSLFNDRVKKYKD